MPTLIAPMNSVASALISGDKPRRTIEKTTIGKVLEPGPETKLEITRSSNDIVKASSQPLTSAGAMSGSVITQIDLPRRRTEIERRFFERTVERRQTRLNEHGNECERKRDVRDRQRRDAALRRPAEQRFRRDEQQQQRQTGDDLRHHERRRDETGEHRAPAKSRVAHQRKRGKRAQHHRARSHSSSRSAGSAAPHR